ncbi:MAG: hypothetical protein V4587_14460, partial [Acidobacteriota bacterium]
AEEDEDLGCSCGVASWACNGGATQLTMNSRAKDARLKPRERKPEAAARRGDMNLKIGTGMERAPWVN